MVISVKIWKRIGRINRLRNLLMIDLCLPLFLAQPSPLHTLMQSTLKHFRKTSKWGNNLFKTVCKWVLKAFKWLMLSYWRVFIYIILKVRLLKRNVSLPIIIFKWMGKICKFRQVGEVEGVLGALVGHVNVPIEPAHFAKLLP